MRVSDPTERRTAVNLTFRLLQGQTWPSNLFQKLVELNPTVNVINGGLFLSDLCNIAPPLTVT